jgi:4-hydroxy-3-methylbut-2-enyl diphosphate reductase IspH
VPDDRSTMELLEEVQPHVVTAVSVALPIMGQSAPEEVVAAVYDTLQQIIDRLL